MIQYYGFNLITLVILSLFMVTQSKPAWDLFGKGYLPEPTWECIAIPNSGEFFINYMIISWFATSLHLYRIGDRLYELWLMLTSYSCGAKKTAYKLIGQGVNKELTGLNSNGLTEAYVSVLFTLSIAFTFCVSCPLVSFSFLLYLMTKHMVDIQNFRRYYTAQFHDDLLVSTALKIALFSTFLININIAALVLSSEDDGNHMTMLSACIATFSIFGLKLSHATGWTWPYNLFHKKKQQQEHENENDLDDTYNRSYIDHTAAIMAKRRFNYC